MKLAEALILRSDIQKQMEQLAVRIRKTALAQEGDTPPEDPNELLVVYEKSARELRDLIVAINHTNATTPFDVGFMTDALAERNRLKAMVTLLRDTASAATVIRSAQTRSEIKFVATVNVSALQKKIDQLSRDLRVLDTKIQSANWTTDMAGA